MLKLLKGEIFVLSVEAFIVIGLRGKKRGEERGAEAVWYTIATVKIPYNGDPDET